MKNYSDMTAEELKNEKDRVLNEYKKECEDISDQCVEERYPSHGSNYDLRCTSAWDGYYKEEIEYLDELIEKRETKGSDE